MPKSKEQNLQIKQQRREQILNAALELFATQGYYATSIEQIANQVGISKGLVYNYFSSKKQILTTIIEQIFAHIDGLFADYDPETLTEQQLEQMLWNSYDMIVNDYYVFRLYFMLYLQPDIERLVKPMINNYLVRTVNFLTPYYTKRGVKQPRTFILTMLSALDGFALHYVLMQYPESKQMLKIIIDKFVRP